MIVWVEMLPGDARVDVSGLAAEMNDAHVTWFHDPKRRAGEAIAASLGGQGRLAWDVYLFYDSRSVWKGAPPSPRGWVHQLSDKWADPARRRRGDELEAELATLLKDIAGKDQAV
jgi:hypothetical protein